jgi:hypothetical protein
MSSPIHIKLFSTGSCCRDKAIPVAGARSGAAAVKNSAAPRRSDYYGLVVRAIGT